MPPSSEAREGFWSDETNATYKRTKSDLYGENNIAKDF